MGEFQIPAATLRLFDGYAADDLARPESRDFLVERLLEAGDRDDLLFLTRTFPEAEIRDIFQAARGLTVRSRRFWALVLEGRLDTEPAAHDEIWPL